MKICAVPECDRPWYGANWCRLHWRRWKKHGDPLDDNAGHGMTGTKVYNAWRAMKQRTTWEKGREYIHYGGRGITVCDEWSNSFEAFYAYIGDPPGVKWTIERIDNDRGYEPGNIKWATYTEQAENKRILKNRHNLAGVQRTKNTYWSMATIKGKRVYLGSFNTAEAAHSAYLKAISDRGREYRPKTSEEL